MTPTQPEPVPHGGDLDVARAQFPEAPEPWIDLSTGINPEPYPVPELDLAAWSRLPQPSQDLALRRAAAHRYGADEIALVVPAPGTQSLIQLIPRLVGQSRVAILGPTYAEHAAAWRREGHDVVDVRDIGTTAGASVVVVVNPNNPTGRVVPAGELRACAAALHRQGGLLVVDEAFADVMPRGVSIVPALPRATIVLRSFGKTYGLAGLRLGFAIAHEQTAARLRDHLGPWCVSVPAMTIGIAALSDDGWLEASIARLESKCRRLDGLLETCGCSIVGGTPLFRLASHASASRVADALGRHGIHVRRFAEHPTWLRLGLPGSEQAWHRLEHALRAANDTQSAAAGLAPGG
jgi:cobalamin biosynthetic protein CobC